MTKKRRYFSPYDHMAFISVKEASHHVTFIWWLTILTNYQKKVRFFLDRRHAMSTCRLENLWQKTEEIYFFSIIDVLFHGHIKTVVDIVDKMSKNMPRLCHAQVTFRQLLTMLAIFDLSFIVCAFISFSLPQLSPHWKVSRIRITLMKIFGQFWGDYEAINLGIFDLIFVTISFCCHSLN